MAAIYLGTTISGATRLPPLRWLNGAAPEVGTDFPNSVELATMLNGEVHAHFKSKDPRRWALAWEMLTAAELATLVGFKEERQELYFQNNWESATWYTVVITDFQCPPFIRAGDTCQRFGVSMTLQEVGS